MLLVEIIDKLSAVKVEKLTRASQIIDDQNFRDAILIQLVNKITTDKAGAACNNVHIA